jgi:hypothetical protein
MAEALEISNFIIAQVLCFGLDRLCLRVDVPLHCFIIGPWAAVYEQK